ncbi:3-deoxy-D-manno-octulosonate 8-phosphate phosphatase (KDO 8-P phosphatase) [Cnuella takakiae]|uniref:3-deoxy-D-manno-octulosonate 8-phosphate phosphatase (KDO 8-P phosphatase) n=1 Tax=Cnuella takakiae TaxID=1302690 RepID=A0A1M4V0Z2_9BACT|nr:HAD hydrolase family protein [Cnuella takakiae]OLY92737.1 3-deoxy-D-manno-octulosonate 8-phosphate phosphatase [Cnuella takakiae]SHE62615.1 3-deoxy-D-manno-octulosonate 8-phosphate phosphatase (KDO 8-P phosphatase) [Cnuella takakiae]
MNVLAYFHQVTTFVFDIDGVLTDGTVLLLENGLQARQMHVKDGLALQMALKNGYRVVIISGGYSEPVIGRFQKLGVQEVFLDVKDKKGFLDQYLKEQNLRWEEVLFMGDDLPDVAVLQVVGVPTCPADAVMEVKRVAKYISPIKGGFGCARDVIEKVLKLNNHWHFDTSVTSR